MTRALIIDNYDSFTHNLAQLLHGLAEEVRVIRNDQIHLSEVQAIGADRIILSPGPGRPDRPRDFGVCADIVEAAKAGTLGAPLLGVCLGHQGIAHAFGATVARGVSVVHGKTSLVHHEGRGLLAGLPRPFEAMRYHSLIVEAGTLPAELEATAFTEDGVLMALEHRKLPIYGVQFHPESIGTPTGRELMQAFFSDRAEVRS